MVRTSHIVSSARSRGRDVTHEAEDLYVPWGVFRNIASTRAGFVSIPARFGGTRTLRMAAA
jgi:hypothetical protein